MTLFGQVLTPQRAVRIALLLAVFGIGAVATVHLFERMLLSQVQAVTETANVAITRILVNEAWEEMRPMIDAEAGAQPRDNPFLRSVDLRVRRLTKGTDLIKVKIYNPQGITVYSSDPKQLGENKAANKGFQTALQGQVVSETTFRGKFGAFDGELYQRNLVSSYVPIQGTGGVEAVVELYTDRTTSIESVNAEIRDAWVYFGPGAGMVFILVLLLTQLGRFGKAKHAAAAANEAAKMSNAPDAPAALLWEATQALSADRQQLKKALLANPDATTGSEAWRAVNAPLQSLLARIEELVLIQKPEQLNAQTGSNGQQPLGALVESAVAAFRGRHAEQGIELIGHVAPALVQHNPNAPQALARLVALLLDEASRRTGIGLLRLSFQQGAGRAMQIEVVGTRADGMPTPDASHDDHSLTLSAAHALARHLEGSIERTSSSAQGPWLSATLPLSVSTKTPMPAQ